MYIVCDHEIKQAMQFAETSFWHSTEIYETLLNI